MLTCAPVLDQRQTHALLEALDADFGADTVWLFGSQASGRATETSDIDVAVLFKQRPDVNERIELSRELARRLGRDVDLVDLDAASPALCMQVLKSGTLLADRNPRRRIAFTTRLVPRYEDLRRLRAPIERQIRERMKHGRT